jgi:dTDP-4-dehydrorhamnose 3,5-epimerase
MHYQVAPHAETKLIRCNKGAIYDVVLDLRPQSPTFKDWIAVVLMSEKRNTIYVPQGCAHGFLTLEDDSEVSYQMSAFRIGWPEKVAVISERDRTYADFKTT